MTLVCSVALTARVVAFSSHVLLLYVSVSMTCKAHCCVQETSAKLTEAVQKVDEMSADVQFIGQQIHKLNAFIEVAYFLVLLLHGDS